MSFQATVKTQPGVAVPGDFAGANMYANVLAAAGALIACDPANAPTPYVGHFAFTYPDGSASAAYHGYAASLKGFVHRDLQAQITLYLGESTMQYTKGAPVTLYNEGSFWGAFAAGATAGQKVFASVVDGSLTAAAAGASQQSFSGTGSVAFTGGKWELTVTAVASGALTAGAALSTGGAIASQLSGTIGGAGVYVLSSDYATFGGGAVASGAVTAVTAVETNFYCETSCNAGELAKISSFEGLRTV